MYGEIDLQRANLQVLNKSVTDTEKIKESIDQTVKSLNSVNPLIIKRLEVFLPESVDEIRFVNNLQGISVKNGLVISNILIEDDGKEIRVGGAGMGGNIKRESAPLPQGVALKASSSEEKKYVTTKIKFDVVARYDGFRLFIDDLEKSLGLINIKSLEFQEYKEPSAGVSKTSIIKEVVPRYMFKVEIETYSLK